MALPECSLSTGDTTWIILATAFCLMMGPALAFFEAGMLRAKHSLSIITQVFAGTCMLSCLWLLVGYSFAFGTTFGGIIGGFDHVLWLNVPYDKCGPHSSNIPAALHALFQMMFATITPLIMTGSYAERLRWEAFLIFTLLWEILVYYPAVHWVWGGGFLAQWGVLDYAGGIVVHTSAGAGALAIALFLGPRADFLQYMGEAPPSNVPLAGVGTALLWMGWFGFNGGSAMHAGNLAVSAVVSTHVAACVSCVVWLVLSMWNHRPAATAMFNGILAGLAGITPASGFVSTQATIVIGLLCGLLAYYGSQISKKRFHIDDALDVHWIHGATGSLGSILLGVFGRRAGDGVSDYELHFHSSPWQIFIQTVGVGIVGCYSFAVTWTILSAMKARMGPLAHDEDAQEAGLDWVDHGEVAYCRLNVLREIRTTHPEAISHINGIAIPSEDDYMKHDTGKHPGGAGLVIRPNASRGVGEGYQSAL